MIRRGALLASLAALVLGSGCSCQSRPAPAPLAIPEVPAWFPAKLEHEKYVGAAACAECHADQYAKWQRSPHGRAMARPDPKTVLGRFDAQEVAIPDGRAIPRKIGDDFVMEVLTTDPEARPARDLARVDLIIASGRQHQVYLTLGGDGSYRMLPLIWLTVEKRWLPASYYQDGSADSRNAEYWRSRDVMTMGCMTCHLSQSRHRLEGGKVEVAWGDLPVNCESCHGPGKEHIRRRRAGESPDVYKDLHNLSKEEDARLCGQCHGLKAPYHLGRTDDGPAAPVLGPISLHALRADGTQLKTAYQLAGHLSSRCFLDGEMTCSACHTPHDQRPRDLAGNSAEGADSDRQCTACHRNRLDAAAAEAHHRHPAGKVRCVDCHMDYSWISNDPRMSQRTSNHSISIPRPRETIELGLPNACTTCHTDRSPQWALEAVQRWGYAKASGTRGWVQAIDRAKREERGLSGELLKILDDPETSTFLRGAVLDLLAAMPPFIQVASAVRPYTHDEDPFVRFAAWRAIAAHDPSLAAEWQKQTAADPHPYVRVESFLFRDPSAVIERASIERVLRDLLEYSSQPPAGQLHSVAQALEARGEAANAQKVHDLAERLSLPARRR